MAIIVTEQHNEAAVVPAAVQEQSAKTSESHRVGAVSSVVGHVLAPRADRRGITTIEYVIGIVAGITLVGVLIVALSNPAVQHALVGLLEHIFGMGSSVKPGH